eukprot:CAMPEP_0116020542 /NCGR_PEP_ID=MMETSP0321-20121206/9857_1 /TAXON_ID=163516 /ORGANISM="Leptocylindrus danicus var. danicus, Strain B650" /LENGTH=75 /DNA_ID=CAMNT_0003491249 /DNA_START=128 /DNA_END=358 /DNA_ORIENTATION=-
MAGNDKQQEVECLDCQEAKLKAEANAEKAAANSINDNQKCTEEYQAVDQCMKSNNGQISPCQREWKEFRICREQQ